MPRPARWPSSIRLDAGAGTELRLLKPADAPALFAMTRRNLAPFRRWIPAWTHYTRSRASTRALLRSWLRKFRGKEDVALGIWHEGRLVGLVTLGMIDRYNGNADLGYLLDAGFQGRGLARRSCRAAAEYAFGRLGLHRLQACVSPLNLRSLAIPRALGFRKVGIQRRSQRMPRGRRVDLAVFDLLAREWRR